MPTHFEESLQRDIDRIRGKVVEMADLDVRALRGCMKSLTEKDRVLAYSVIFGDQRIDELEKEVDRLCLEFLVRQQPAAEPLRFAYATIRTNLELERVGDYAEGVARQVLKLTSMDVPIPFNRFEEIANLSIRMLEDAVKSFVDRRPDLARKTMATEETVDILKSRLNSDLISLHQKGGLSIEALNPLMMIARHLERVSDQAKNICTEAVYMCTGEYERHKGSESIRLLFVDVRNSCRSQMAEAIANSLQQPRFVFSSAGLEPDAIDPMTLGFLKDKGLDPSRLTSKSVKQIPNLDHYQILIALAQEARIIFPGPPTKTVCLDWSLKDPSKAQGTPSEIHAAYEAAYQFLHDHIGGLVEAVIGNNLPHKSKNIP